MVFFFLLILNTFRTEGNARLFLYVMTYNLQQLTVNLDDQFRKYRMWYHMWLLYFCFFCILKYIVGNPFLANPANIYLLKVSIKNTRKRCKISSKLTIKTLQRYRSCRSNVFIVNFKHISHLFLVFLILTFNS